MSQRSSRKRSRKSVLTEEEYVDGMRKIIRRDFFPDFDLLQAKYNYMKAQENADLIGMQQAQERLEILQQNSNSIEPQKSLDEFLAQYTSEDNASFEQILFQMSQNRRQQHWWAVEREHSTDLQHRKRVQLTIPNNKTISSCNGTNSLMFIPDSLNCSKEHVNTRHNNINHSCTNYQSISNELKEAKSETSKIPTEKYKFVPNTPTNIHFSPTNSFVDPEISHTKLLLKNESTSGTQYKLPPTPSRELLATQLLNSSRSNQSSKLSAISKTTIPKTPAWKSFSSSIDQK